MALERKDNIGDTTTSTGTGTINLAAVAQTGARIFAGNVTSGATVRYHIESSDRSEWEIGEGVFTDGSPDTLTRVTVYASSNAGSLVNFSAGTKNVSLVYTAADRTVATGAEINTGTDTDKIVTPKAVADSYIPNMYYGMARQAIMNGNFDVWQRGTSVATPDNSVTFQADRWSDIIDKNGGTLPTLTRSRQLQTSGDIPGSYYFSRLATNGAGTSLGVSSYHFLSQKIENGTRNLCGASKKVTVSFWARSSITNKRITPTLAQNYGTGGSPTADEQILGTPITLTSTWTKYTATFTTNTLVGKTFGTNNDDFLWVKLWHMWGTTVGNNFVQASVTAETYVGSGNIDIAQVQLCAGDVALPFQPKSFEEELRACQRYYEKSYDYGTAVGTATTVAGAVCDTILTAYLNYGGFYNYKVKKRTAATPTLYSSNNASTTGVQTEYNAGSVYVADRAIAAVTASESGFNSTRNNAGTVGSIVKFHWTVDAEL